MIPAAGLARPPERMTQSGLNRSMALSADSSRLTAVSERFPSSFILFPNTTTARMTPSLAAILTETKARNQVAEAHISHMLTCK